MAVLHPTPHIDRFEVLDDGQTVKGERIQAQTALADMRAVEARAFHVRNGQSSNKLRSSKPCRLRMPSNMLNCKSSNPFSLESAHSLEDLKIVSHWTGSVTDGSEHFNVCETQFTGSEAVDFEGSILLDNQSSTTVMREPLNGLVRNINVAL